MLYLSPMCTLAIAVRLSNPMGRSYARNLKRCQAGKTAGNLPSRPSRALSRVLCCIATVVCATCSMAVSNASTIYSNFGPAGSLYNTGLNNALGLGYVTLGSTNVDLTEALQFTIPTGVWTVTQVDVAVRNITAPADAFFGILSDGDGQPGSLFWSTLVTGIPNEDNSCCALTTVPITSGNPILSSFEGTTYWFVVGSGSAANNTDGWQTTNVSGQSAFSTSGLSAWTVGGVETMGAFDVQGTNELGSASAPEPEGFLLAGCGMGALLVVRRRSKSKLTIAPCQFQ
jgi:hypothetical protein